MSGRANAGSTGRIEWSEEKVRQLMELRLEELKTAIATLSRSKTAKRIKGIGLLCDLFARRKGVLRSLQLAFPDTRTTAGTYLDWEAIDSGKQPRFHIHREVVQKFLEVQIQAQHIGLRRDYWHFDLFFIHELLHAYQGMERGKHRGYQTRSPAILNVLDYEADAIAVVTLFVLALLSPENFFGRFVFLRNEKPANQDSLKSHLLAALKNVAAIAPYWGTLARIIHAQVWHLSVFTAAMVDTKRAGNAPQRSLQIASQRSFTLQKVERTFAWYLQYFRALHYRADARLGELGILRQPLVEFRNVRAAAGKDRRRLTRDWPQQELEFVTAEASALSMDTDPPVIMGVQGPLGLIRISRYTASSASYRDLFAALFDGNLQLAEPFFVEMFRQNPWLNGLADNPILGTAPTHAQIANALNTTMKRKSDFLALADRKVREHLRRTFVRV